MRNILVIFNQKKSSSLRILKKLEESLKLSNISFKSIESEYAGHVIKIVEEANFDDFTDVVGIGGDGTLNEIVNALIKTNYSKKIKVGVIPHGTGNDFIRTYGSSNIEFWIKKIIQGETQEIDAVRIDTGKKIIYSIQNVGWGLFWEGLRYSRPFVWLGSFCYTIGTIICFFLIKIRISTIYIDEKKLSDEEFWGMSICNVPHAAGGMNLAPMALPSDGKVNLITLRKSLRLRLIWGFIKFNFNMAEGDPYLQRHEAKKLRIELKSEDKIQVDGETIDVTCINTSVVANAWIFIC